MPVYRRIGQCKQCGDCCREETVPARIAAYKKAKIEFTLVNVNCGKFDPTTGKCKDYEHRPQTCKLFPMQIVDIAALPNCSYRFELLVCPECGTELRGIYFLGDRSHLDFVDCPKCGIAYDPYTMKPIAHVIS
jgi:Fe-S-cluster containining protein